MERQVTIPLEIALAGMPGLKATHSRSLFGLSHLRNVFQYGHDYDRARQEVINRLQPGDGGRTEDCGGIIRVEPQESVGCRQPVGGTRNHTVLEQFQIQLRPAGPGQGTGTRVPTF
jgi:hypothetical protein